MSMGLFSRKKEQAPLFPPERYEPVLRCSICTGEQVGCMRDRHSGKLLELMLIRTREDLAAFCRLARCDADSIRKIY